MVWRVTNEPVDCRPSRGTNKHTQDRKRCSLLDDNSTATADYNSAHANYTINYIRQLQNHDYIHMTTTTSYKSILPKSRYYKERQVDRKKRKAIRW